TPGGAAMTAFHLASVPGLSGLSTSPDAADVATINVRAINLADYLVAKGLLDVDFIKVGAGGQGLAVFRSLDFTKAMPRLAMVEFDDQFAGQDRETIGELLAHMQAVGYRACVICLHGPFDPHQWHTRLQAIGVDRVPVLPTGARLFGNILFFRNDDG